MSNSFGCPKCRNLIDHNPDLAGTEVSCPHCQYVFRMSGVTAPAAAPAPPRKPAPVADVSVETNEFAIDATPSEPNVRLKDGGTTGSGVTSPRREKQKEDLTPQQLAGGCLAIAVGFLGLMAMFSGGGLGTVDKGDFKDNPEQFDGQTVTIDRMYLRGGKSLKRHREDMRSEWSRYDYYYGYFVSHDPTHVRVDVRIPWKMKVPNIQDEPVTLKFHCKKGKWGFENELISIERD